MDPSLYTVRPFEDRDYDAYARVLSRNEPRQPVTGDELRHWNSPSSRVPGRVHLKLVVDERRSNRPVAFAELSHGGYDYHPRKFWTGVEVDPDFQHRGLGRALYGQIEQLAVDRDALCVWSGTSADQPRGVAFLRRNGFVERRRTWVSLLTVDEADLTQFPDRSETLAADGIRITTAREEGEPELEFRQRLFRAVSVAARDVPRMGEYTPVAFEQFVTNELETPGALPEAIFLARVGNEYVGMSSLERDLARPDTLRVGFTGIRPEYRRKGIGSELKRRAVVYAGEHGCRYLITFNDSLNRPIWAINERLGFRPQFTRIQAEKTLRPSPA